MSSRILLADDSITIQKVVNLTFADEGIEVVSVSNGEMAERRLDEINPDLVLADIFMPGKNGYELCEHIKQSPQFQNVPVVLLVGAFEPFDQNEARRVKADAHLTKPFESRNLVETVRKLIKDSNKPTTASLSQPRAAEESVPHRVAPEELKPLAPPPVNIDFSAMSNDWPPAENNMGFDTGSDMGFASLSQTSPLTIDLDKQDQTPSLFGTSEQTEPNQNADNDFDNTLVMGSPFATDAASEVEPQEINISIGDSAQPAESSAEMKTESETPSDIESARVGVPSAFGHAMQEVIVDFDKTDEPSQHEPENIVSFDAETSFSSVDETGATVLANVEVEEAATQEPEEIAVETQNIEGPAQAELTEPETTDDQIQVAADSTPSEYESESLEPQTLLETDSPLGDILVDDRTQAAFSDSEYDASDSSADDALDLAPPAPWSEAPSDMVVPHMSADYPSQSHFDAPTATASYEAQAVVETTNSAVAVVDMPAGESAPDTGSSFDIVMAATEDVAWQTAESETALEPPAETVTSEQWSAETQFVAIDAETAKLDEHQVESVSVETGFEFKPVTESEHLTLPEEPESSTEVEQTASASETVSQQPLDASAIPDTVIDQIVRRVVERMSSDVVREIAWEVVPDMVERVVREVAQDSASKKA